MSQDEFFAFMPLLIYGIAVSELIMHWRDYLKSKRRYWPHLVTGILLLELAFSNFYYLYDKLEFLFVDYISFLARLSAPLLFLLTVSVYTPEDNKDIKVYFHEKLPLIFGLLGTFGLINAIMDFGDPKVTFMRFVLIGISYILALTKKLWVFWFLIFVRIIFFIWLQIFPNLLM